MRVVIQRVKEAEVKIKAKVKSKIGFGLLIFVGIEDNDNSDDVSWLVSKIVKMRIFDDNQGVMNLSVNDINGEILVVSQFTLHASTKKGNRPSYIKAARPEHAIPLFNQFLSIIQHETQRPVKTGEFGAMMDVSLINDGPVTILMDSKNKDF